MRVVRTPGYAEQRSLTNTKTLTEMIAIRMSTCVLQICICISATLPVKEPDEQCEWIAQKRMGRFLPNARKPRPVLIEFSSVEEKHKLLRAL